MREQPWIGVDLDGTLAHYDGWNEGVIGDPIPLMVERVKNWMEEGVQVRILTARVGFHAPGSPEWWAIVIPIHTWCVVNIGYILPVTATKDFAMIECWDDRAIQVVRNSGERVDGYDGR